MFFLCEFSKGGSLCVRVGACVCVCVVESVIRVVESVMLRYG